MAESETWTNEDVVEAILESKDQIVEAVDRLRRTIITIVLVPVGLWVLAMLIGAGMSFMAQQ